MSEVMYTLTGVCKIYDGRTVLDIDDLDIYAGEILAVVGPSGAGKSTLLRLLNFLELPDRGQLTFQRQAIPSGGASLALRREVTTVFQRPALLSTSVTKNVTYGLRLRGQRDGKAGLQAILEQLGLSSLAHARAHTLSGGEAQRVALARALVIHPKVLLLDEPTANLDPYNVNLIESVVADINRRSGTTVVVVTHNIFQARRLAHRVILLLNGQIVELADTSTFFESPSDPRTQAFVRGEMVF